MRNTKIVGFCILFLILSSLVYADKVLEVTEGDLVKLNINIEDPDGDNLVINYSKPLNEEGKWQTKLGDEGVYYANITVSDGESVSTEQVKILVNKLPLPEFKKEFFLEEGERLEFQFPENVTLKELPSGMVYSNNKLIWTPHFFTVKPSVNVIERKLFKWQMLGELNLNQTQTFVIPATITVNSVNINDSVKVIVRNKNRAPYFVNISDNIRVKEGDKLRIQYFVEDLDEDKLFVSFSGFVEENNKVMRSYEQGEHKITVEVSDGQLSETREINVFVEDMNRLPEYTGKKNIIVNENETVELTLRGKDPDGNFSFVIKRGLNVSKIVNETLIVNPGFDFVSYPNEKRQDVIVLELNDGDNKVEQNINLTVRNVDRKVNIISVNHPQKFIVKRGSVVKFEINANDPDNGNLTYYWDGIKSEKNNHYRKMLTPGVRKFKVKVSDGESSDELEWKFLVK